MSYIKLIIVLFVIALGANVKAQDLDFSNAINISLTKLAFDTTINAPRYNLSLTRVALRYDAAADTTYRDTSILTFNRIDSSYLAEQLYTFNWNYYAKVANAESYIAANKTPRTELTVTSNALNTMTGGSYLDNARIKKGSSFTGRWILVYNGTRYRMLATLQADRIRFRQVDANGNPIQGGFNGRLRIYNENYISLMNVVGANTNITFAPDLDERGRWISGSADARLWKRR